LPDERTNETPDGLLLFLAVPSIKKEICASHLRIRIAEKN
jgi:hypothetical protein